MNKQVVLYAMILILAALPIVSANIDQASISYVLKQNHEYDIKRGCINAGGYCTVLANCTLTITNVQTGELITNAALMTNQGAYHNYTLSSTDTLGVGYYKADMSCNDPPHKGTGTFYYQITPSGDVNLLGLHILICVLGLVILFVGIYTRMVSVTILGGFAVMAIGIYNLNYGIDVYRNFITETISILMIALGAFWAGKAGLEQLEVI